MKGAMLQWWVISLILLFSLQPVEQQETDASETNNISKALGKLVEKSNRQLRELQSLRNDLTSLRDSVRRLNDSPVDFQDSIAELSDVVVGLNDSVRGLHEEHKEQRVTITQQMNTKLNTLISDLSQRQQQTAAESAQFQTSFTQLYQNLTNNFTYQLDTIQQHIENPPVHTCGGTGGWRRVVYLDMTAPNTTCPSGWQLTGHSKRTCGKVSSTARSCDSVTFPVSGGEYSRVCGRIKAYQYGGTDAFEAYDDGEVTTIDGAYVAGVSLTHGTPRSHIWTFAAGISEALPTRNDACPCDASVTIRVPPFMGDDYFCESGVNAGSTPGFHPNDSLWDGQNCIYRSKCCSFNTPPYFVKQLPTFTTDDIEARLCQYRSRNDSPIELIELYVQ